MSLIISLYQCPQASIKLVATIEQCNALLNWFDRHIMELHSDAIIELSKDTLQQLLADLNKLSANNCKQLFPTIPNFVHGAFEYDAAYWQKVVQLRTQLQQLLASFDFNQQRLFLRGSW